MFLLSVGVVSLSQYQTGFLMVRCFDDDDNVCILSSFLFVGVLVSSQYRRGLITVRRLEHDNDDDDKCVLNIKLNKVMGQ